MANQVEQACDNVAYKGASDRGIFITFEGGEGAGKTTHIRFLAEALRARGREVVCLREPGGTSIGEALRAVVLDPAHDEMSPEAELLIYEAARAQIVTQVIRPALARGAVVLCDRFSDSTLAYQAYGRGLSREFVDKANTFATGGLCPDRTILLVTGGTAETGLLRATHRETADRIELAGEDFHTRVNEAFLQLAEAEPERIRVVVSNALKSITSAIIFQELTDLFPWMADATVCSEAFFAPLDVARSKSNQMNKLIKNADAGVCAGTGTSAGADIGTGAGASAGAGPGAGASADTGVAPANAFGSFNCCANKVEG